MSDTQQHTGARKWLTLFVLALAVAIVVIDGTVLNVSINNIINDLGTDLQSIQWAITSYSLVIASLTIFGGRLGDWFGRKRAFIIGAIIFGIGSLITALSPNIGWLILGWSFVEGIGAALMVPASSSLLVSNYEGKDRATAFGLYGATAGIASAIGPILGGYLTSSFSWRWAFGINLFVVLALIVGSRFVKGYVLPQEKRPTLDYLGVILSALGLSTLTYGFIESSTYGWFGAKKAFEAFGNTYDLAGISISFWAILLGLVVIAGFILWEIYLENHDHKEPLVAMSIFKNRQFSVAIAMISIIFSGFTGIITFGVILFYQNVLGLGALESGVGLIPLSLGIFVMAPLSAKIAAKIGGKLTIQLGLLIATAASVLLYYEMSVDATQVTFIPALAIFGIGFGLIISQITNLILSSVPVSKAGEASGLNGTIREVGRAFGTAIIGAVFIATLASSMDKKVTASTIIPEPAKPAIIKAFSNGDVEASKSNSTNTPAIIKDEIKKDVNESIVESSKMAITYTGGFTLIGFLISFLLPKKHMEEQIEKEALSEDAPVAAH